MGEILSFSFTKRKLTILTGLFVGLLFCVFIAPKAHAAQPGQSPTFVFPRPNGYVLLSKYKCSGHCLETPSVGLKVFYDTQDPAFINETGDLQVSIEVLCRGIGTGGWFDATNNPAQAVPYCGANNQQYTLSFSIPKSALISDPGKYTARYKYAHIGGWVTTQEPLIAFRALANNANGGITFDESNPSLNGTEFPDVNMTNGNYTTPNGYSADTNRYGIGSSFALWDNYFSQGTGATFDFSFYFKTDCNFTGSQSTIRWYDGDAAEGGTQTAGMRMQLIDKGTDGTGNFVFLDTGDTNFIGNNDAYRDYTFNIAKDHIYEWRWVNISRTNGIQLWMPFSEQNTAITCESPPIGGPGPTACNLGTFTYKSIWDGGAQNHTENAAITGWVQDKDAIGMVEVYLDADKGQPGSRQVGGGRYWGDKYPISLTGGPPGAPNDPNIGAGVKPSFGTGAPSWHDWFVVPRSDLAPFDDGKVHNVFIHLVDLDKNWNPTGNDPPSQVTQIGLCETPQCGTGGTTPGTVEVGQPFTASGSFSYNRAGSGQDITYDGTINLDSSQVLNEQHTMNPTLTLTTGSMNAPPGVGTHTVSWYAQWPAVATAFNGPQIQSLINQALARQVSLRDGTPVSGAHNSFAAPNGLTYMSVTCGSNYQVGRIPYYKIYGNDAAVGKGFNNGIIACTTTNYNATFRGFNKDGSALPASPSYDFMRGAGAQFALFALGISPSDGVQEVPSSGMKVGDSQNDQTFANTNIVSGTPVRRSTDYGGQGGVGNCIPDFFSKNTITASTARASVTPGVAAAGDDTSLPNTIISYVRPVAGQTSVIINGTANSTPAVSTLAVRKKHTIFVDGDARIANDTSIKYASFNNIADAPNFTLVVKGNIYIDDTTSQLDGLYIAQPKPDGTKGQIITCYRSGLNDPVPQDLLDDNCNNKLTINGAFIAREVKLLRTKGTLSNGIASVSAPPNFSWSYVNVATDPNRHCITIREPGLPGNDTWENPPDRESVWYDNWLCARNGLGIQWVNNGTYGLGGALSADQAGWYDLPQGSSRNKTVTIDGVQKECVLFYEPAMSNSLTAWNDNWLCMDQNNDYALKFYHGGADSKPSSNAGTCIAIWEPSDSWPAAYQSPIDGSWQSPSAYNGTWHDNWLCVVNTYTNPSNPEQSTDDNIAEVFNFSPELYVQQTTWSTQQSSTKGKYDSISNLPPVF